jgi:hypothetical protein
VIASLAWGAIRTLPDMTATLIGYARCSTDAQGLTAQRQALASRPRRRHPCRPGTRPARPVRPQRPRHRRLPRGPRRTALPRRHHLRPHRPARQDVLQHPRHLRRVRGRPTPATHPRRDAVARAKGKPRGKQPKHTTRQQRELVRMHNTGEYSKANLASCSPSPEPPCTGSSNATAPPQPEQARNSNRCFCAGSYGDPFLTPQLPPAEPRR